MPVSRRCAWPADMRITGSASATARGTTLNTGFGFPDYSWDIAHTFNTAAIQPFPGGFAFCPGLTASFLGPNVTVYNVPPDTIRMQFQLDVSLAPASTLTSLDPPCSNQFRRRGDGVAVPGFDGLTVALTILGNSAGSSDLARPSYAFRVWPSNHPMGVDPSVAPPLTPFYQVCRAIKGVGNDPPATGWEATVTWGLLTVSPRWRSNGCLYGASGSASMAYTWRRTQGSVQIEGFSESTFSFDIDSNLGLCCGFSDFSPDELAHARDKATFESMRANLRGDPEEIAQRMRFGRACRGCG